jgi:molybdopterin-guanine dinucleotide biosynthesis protein
MARPTIVGVGGLASEVGKTTLMCELLRAMPGWEAIKTTRGHRRSCGKDPSSCCVSHLLADEPVIRSGRSETYTPGKDTGRYWDAGAANVHWLIATNEQLDQGINLALERVKAPGVLIEGNSFSEYVEVDFMIMVVRSGANEVKSSARRALKRCSAVYVSDSSQLFSSPQADTQLDPAGLLGNLSVYHREDLSTLIPKVLGDQPQAAPSVSC